MGLARISGGLYKIEHCEGTAIASIIPPELKNIDLKALNNAQLWLISEMLAEWEILAHWLVYFRTKAVDIKQLPFTASDFIAQKPKAQLFSQQLDLCAAIWEAIEIRHLYPTPYDWWVDCMVEAQQKQLAGILQNSEGIPKGKIEDSLRGLVRSLSNEEIPLSKAENPHIYRMLACAINLKIKSREVRNAWKNYLLCLKALARQLKSDGFSKSVVRMGDRLYYRDRHTLKQIDITSVNSDIILNIRAKFAVQI